MHFKVWTSISLLALVNLSAAAPQSSTGPWAPGSTLSNPVADGQTPEVVVAVNDANECFLVVKNVLRRTCKSDKVGILSADPETNRCVSGSDATMVEANCGPDRKVQMFYGDQVSQKPQVGTLAAGDVVVGLSNHRRENPVRNVGVIPGQGARLEEQPNPDQDETLLQSNNYVWVHKNKLEVRI